MFKEVRPITRRTSLRLLMAAGASVVILPTESLIAESLRKIGGEKTSGTVTQDGSRKFNADGTPRPFAGNTVICPVSRQSDAFAQLARIPEEWQQHAFVRRIALLPPSSYHMTVFSGANDQDRIPGLWPAGVPLDAPMAECDKIVGQRLMGARFPLAVPLRFRIDDDPANQVEDGSGVRLLPIDDMENRKVRDLRNRLSEVMQIRAPDHDTYRFHISLGYWVQAFTPDERADYTSTLSGTLARLTSRIQSIELQTPVYCTFGDMLAYKIVGSLPD